MEYRDEKQYHFLHGTSQIFWVLCIFSLSCVWKPEHSFLSSSLLCGTLSNVATYSQFSLLPFHIHISSGTPEFKKCTSTFLHYNRYFNCMFYSVFHHRWYILSGWLVTLLQAVGQCSSAVVRVGWSSPTLVDTSDMGWSFNSFLGKLLEQRIWRSVRTTGYSLRPSHIYGLPFSCPLMLHGPQ